MSRDDTDFAAYLAARWPFLVRTMVLLGCGRAEAEDVARAGLARCYASWDRVRREDDVDVDVYREVLDQWRRGRRRRWRGEAPTEPPPEPPPGPDATDQVRLRHALDAELRRLDPEQREVLVLRFVADLSEVQVADVLDEPVETIQARIVRGVRKVDLEALSEVRGG